MKPALISLFLLIFTVSAYADENRNFFPMGEKELFSGNTGTAGIESSAASYFNPAALTQIKDNKLSVSASAFYYASFERKPTANIEDNLFNYKATSFNTVPSSINTVLNFDGWTGAFSILVPFSQSYENQQEWTSPSKKIYYEEKQEESELWVGVSAAKKFGDHWSFGVSAFALKSYSLSMTSFTMVNRTPQTAGQIESTRVQTNIWSASVILGILHENDNFDWGLKIHSPTVKVMGSGDYYSSTISYESGYYESVINKKDIDADTLFPADFSLGFNFHATSKLNIMADVSYQLGGSFDEFSDAEVIASIREENHIKTLGQYRVNLAVEYFPTDKLDLLAGAYYVPSAAPKSAEQRDGIGFATGGYYATKNTKSGLGLFALRMDGTHPVDESDVTGETIFSIFGAVLSTSYNF